MSPAPRCRRQHRTRGRPRPGAPDVEICPLGSVGYGERRACQRSPDRVRNMSSLGHGLPIREVRGAALTILGRMAAAPVNSRRWDRGCCRRQRGGAERDGWAGPSSRARFGPCKAPEWAKLPPCESSTTRGSPSKTAKPLWLPLNALASATRRGYLPNFRAALIDALNVRGRGSLAPAHRSVSGRRRTRR